MNRNFFSSYYYLQAALLCGFWCFVHSLPLFAQTQISTSANTSTNRVQSLVESGITPDSLLTVGLEMMQIRKYAEAQAAFEAVVKADPRNAEALCRLCQMDIVQERNLEKAEEYCLRAVQINPKNADFHYWLGAVYGLQAINGELIDALAVASRLREAFTKALKLNPKHGNARFALAQYYLQAPQYAGGSFKEARKLGNEAMSFDEVTARRILASVYRAEKKSAAAEDEYRRAVENDKKNVDVLSEFASFYVGEKRFNEAVECYQRCLEIDSTNMFVLQALGDVLASEGRFEEAIKVYEQALTIHPRHTPALMGLARVYERQRNKPEALRCYLNVFKMDPRSKIGKEANKKFRELQRKDL
jgi:tetratricopeptide (TPR) repeat protein